MKEEKIRANKLPVANLREEFLGRLTTDIKISEEEGLRAIELLHAWCVCALCLAPSR